MTQRRVRIRMLSARRLVAVEPWVEGEQLAKEMLNLVGGEGEAVAVLREQILNNCFRELELDS